MTLTHANARSTVVTHRPSRGALARARASDKKRDASSTSTRPSEAIVEASSVYPVRNENDMSFARCGYASQCEEALNRQINIECTYADDESLWRRAIRSRVGEGFFMDRGLRSEHSESGVIDDAWFHRV